MNSSSKQQVRGGVNILVVKPTAQSLESFPYNFCFQSYSKSNSQPCELSEQPLYPMKAKALSPTSTTVGAGAAGGLVQRPQPHGCPSPGNTLQPSQGGQPCLLFTGTAEMTASISEIQVVFIKLGTWRGSPTTPQWSDALGNRLNTKRAFFLNLVTG